MRTLRTLLVGLQCDLNLNEFELATGICDLPEIIHRHNDDGCKNRTNTLPSPAALEARAFGSDVPRVLRCFSAHRVCKERLSGTDDQVKVTEVTLYRLFSQTVQKHPLERTTTPSCISIRDTERPNWWTKRIANESSQTFYHTVWVVWWWCQH